MSFMLAAPTGTSRQLTLSLLKSIVAYVPASALLNCFQPRLYPAKAKKSQYYQSYVTMAALETHQGNREDDPKRMYRNSSRFPSPDLSFHRTTSEEANLW